MRRRRRMIWMRRNHFATILSICNGKLVLIAQQVFLPKVPQSNLITVVKFKFERMFFLGFFQFICHMPQRNWIFFSIVFRNESLQQRIVLFVALSHYNKQFFLFVALSHCDKQSFYMF